MSPFQGFDSIFLLPTAYAVGSKISSCGLSGIHGMLERISPGGCLIDNEELRSGGGRGAVRRTAVANMVALTRLQAELGTIAQHDIQGAQETQDYVTLRAPVIGGITGRVLDHANTDVAKGLSLPKGKASLSGMP